MILGWETSKQCPRILNSLAKWVELNLKANITDIIILSKVY